MLRPQQRCCPALQRCSTNINKIHPYAQGCNSAAAPRCNDARNAGNFSIRHTGDTIASFLLRLMLSREAFLQLRAHSDSIL